MVNKNKKHMRPSEDPSKANAVLWDSRYEAEGHIWGDDPSLTGRLLVKKLAPVSYVLEIGFGYGRDLSEILQHGHRAYGIEVAASGHTEAGRLLDEYIMSGQAQLLRGEFARASLPKGEFDAVISHRVLHLLGKNGLVRAFGNHAARVLKPGGLLMVSARNPQDFNADQMVPKGDGFAEYKDRPGHLIRFWNEKMFEDAFSDDFEILEFVHGKEIESVKNPIDTHFTIMVARRKPEPTPASL